jgi:hypothetical protein
MTEEIMVEIPLLALSIRQPWAWLILYAGKDIENRDWRTAQRGPFLIHASKGMTRDEYRNGVDTLAEIRPDLQLPPFEDLPRGGIVGSAVLADCVSESDSPWFFGFYGYVLRDATPLPFRPYKGALGFFPVK